MYLVQCKQNTPAVPTNPVKYHLSLQKDLSDKMQTNSQLTMLPLSNINELVQAQNIKTDPSGIAVIIFLFLEKTHYYSLIMRT